MQNDDDESSATKKTNMTRDSSWIARAFNPPGVNFSIQGEVNPSYITDLKPKPHRIGDTAKLFRSPEQTKECLSYVIKDKTAIALYKLTESIYIQHGDVLERAALNNWFIQPETPFPFLDMLKACTDDEAAIRDVFAAMMRDQIDGIRDRLKNDFPGRSEILQEGFALHNEQRFFASIPLFLMMAEGIAIEETGKSIFNSGSGIAKGHKPPQIFDWLKVQKLLPMAKTYISVLQAEHPFSRSAKKGQLSRHAVLHGRSTDYGTEIFSLQAISILGLVGWVFSENGLAKHTS